MKYLFSATYLECPRVRKNTRYKLTPVGAIVCAEIVRHLTTERVSERLR